jgi:hypothetical protein
MPEIDYLWTVIFSLVISIFANLLSPKISICFSKLSSSYKCAQTEKQKVFDNSVQHLISNPTDEVNVRIEKNGSYSRSWTLLVAAVILSSLDTDIIWKMFSIPFTVGAIMFFNQGEKHRSLLRQVWETRKKDYGKIDLG